MAKCNPKRSQGVGISVPSRRGQTLIDYLIVVGIALLIALLAIALASSLPGLGQSVQSKNYLDYWNTQARPFVISDDFYRASNSRFYLALNLKTDDQFNLTGIFINDTQLAFYTYDPAYTDGAAVLKCSASSCINAPCSCDLPLRPYVDGRIVTEPFSSSIPVCGPDAQQAQMTVRLVYFRPSNSGQNFTESGNVPLPFSCQ